MENKAQKKVLIIVGVILLLIVILVATVFISIKLLTASSFKTNDNYSNNVNEISPKMDKVI